MFLKNFLEQILIFLYQFTDSYGLSLVLLSLVITLLLLPVYWGINKFQIKERNSRAIIQPALDKIKDLKNGQEKFYYTKEIYKKHNYNPYYSLLGVLGIAVQIPFLLAAYWLLINYTPLQNVSFGPIQDLFSPDRLINFRGLSINVLPFVMTLVNILSIYVTRKNMRKNEKIQLISIAFIFLFFFYSLSSALVLYWTCNNIFALLKNWILLIYNRKNKTTELENESLINFLMLQFVKWKKEIIIILVSWGIYFLALSLVYKVLFGFTITTFISLTASLIFFNTILLIILFKLGKKSKDISFKRIGFFILFIEAVILFNVGTGWLITISKYYAIFSAIFLIIIYLFSFYLGHSFRELKIKNKFQFRDLISLTLILSFPLILYLYSNSGYFNILSSIVYFVLLIGAPVVLFFVIYKCFKKYLQPEFIYLNIVSLFFTLYILPGLTNAFSLTAETNIFIHLILLFATTILFLTIYSKSRKLFSILSFMVFIVSFLQIFLIGKENKVKNEIEFSDKREKTKLYNYLSDKEMKFKPDIYFLVYDSYVNEYQMNSYGIDNSEQMSFFRENDFIMYDKTYSIGPNTTVSMPFVFQIDETNIERPLCNYIIGNSTVDDILQKNGYETNYVLSPFFFRCSDIPFGGDFINNKKLSEFSGEVNPYDGMVSILLSIVMGEFKFNNEFMIDELNYSESERLVGKVIEKQTSSPKFMYHHSMSPGHSEGSGKCRENEIELYKERLEEANKLIKSDVNKILEINKDAIIIIAGDHGPSITFNCKNVLKNVSRDDITSEIIEDRLGVFLGIRYPKYLRNKINTEDYDLLQNTFIKIFKKLYEDESIEDYKMNKEVLFGGQLIDIVKDGKIMSGKDKGKTLFKN